MLSDQAGGQMYFSLGKARQNYRFSRKSTGKTKYLYVQLLLLNGLALLSSFHVQPLVLLLLSLARNQERLQLRRGECQPQETQQFSSVEVYLVQDLVI